MQIKGDSLLNSAPDGVQLFVRTNLAIDGPLMTWSLHGWQGRLFVIVHWLELQ